MNWHHLTADNLLAQSTEGYYQTRLLEYYQDTLYRHQEAMDYLTQTRGLNTHTLRHFKLGYSDHSLAKTLPPRRTLAGEQVRGALQRLGWIRPNGTERFHGAVVFPVCDASGNVVDAYGRRIAPRPRRDVSPYRTLHDVSRCLFNLSAAQHITFLCSTPMEAVTLHQIGIQAVVSTLGMGNLNPVHITQLVNAKVQEVIILLANTEQGRRYGCILKNKLIKGQLKAQCLCLPKDHDINDIHAHHASLKKLLSSYQQGGAHDQRH